MTIDMLQAFHEASTQFLTEETVIHLPRPFTESEAQIPGVRAEYLLGPKKIQFHFWPEHGEEFPGGLEQAIRASVRVFPEERVVVEYVPEVGSWYTHVVDPPLNTSAELAEHLIRKIARALQDG